MGVIRLSGPDSFKIAQTLYPPLPKPRHAALRALLDASGEVIDEGLVIAFKAPHSFTGEDVVEIQAHGSPVVLGLIMNSLVSAGARPAEPGEFSKRAYLNDRIDLVQAEAIADLIGATTEQAARAAQNSLQGVFSKQIHALAEDLTGLRVYVEASLDFPDEDVDFLADGEVINKAQALHERLSTLMQRAQQGQRLNDGALVCLVGHPNVGKSSLLNALSRTDSAIVTEFAGTTRDVVREHLNLNGMPVTVSDTAGLRETQDPVEALGIQKTNDEMKKADLIVWVMDGVALAKEGLTVSALDQPQLLERLQKDYPGLVDTERLMPVINKADAIGEPAGLRDGVIYLSAKTHEGLGSFIDQMTQRLGLEENSETQFTARARHIHAMTHAQEALARGIEDIRQTSSGELLAECLKEAAQALGDITGQITADELLGHIFSSFCIGK